MKISFSRKVPFVPEFNDNKKLPEDKQIKMVLRPLDLSELSYVGEVLKKLGLDKIDKDGKDAKITASSDALKEVTTDLIDIIKAHVTEFVNLEDDDGVVAVESLPLHVPFFPLALEMLIELANISAPGEKDQKN